MSENQHPPSGNVPILFTDIENSARMTRALGDPEYKTKMLDPHCRYIRECIAAQQGFEVKTIGDSFMVAFELADNAISCAEAIQQRFSSSPITAIDEEDKQWQVLVRIGIHKAIEELLPDDKNDYHGNDVNFAARIESLGVGGQIILSESTYASAPGKKGYQWKKWSNRRVKSFSNPETIWELLWDGRTRGEPGSRWLPKLHQGELNSFVGRETWIQKIFDWFNDNSWPLLTLHGFGGIGKTRLAIESIIRCAGMFEGKIAFVSLNK